MKAAIYGRHQSKNFAATIDALIGHLQNHDIEFVLFDPLKNFLEKSKREELNYEVFKTHTDIHDKVDVMISVGGDGTLLDTVALVRDSGIPIMGINSGRLGFLASIKLDKIAEAVESMAKGHFGLDQRTLLKVESNSEIFGDQNFALNELTIHKKDTSSMITIHTYLNGEYLNSYWADGLIISTPTGSTGYSLSCGGPIIVPQSENFIITPIAPHNLNVRPIIVSDRDVITFEIEGRGKHYLASLDSKSYTIDASVKIAVKKEEFKINLMRMNNQNFLSTLRDKLMWGLDNRN